MGVSERKLKEKKIRKNDIIDAAEKVIFSKGYDSATMDNISKEAEFSKRTVYMYFNSKEQIYFEIMVRGYKVMIQMIESKLLVLENKNALERIKIIGITLYEFNNIYPNYFKAIMNYENREKDFLSGITDESKDECYALGEVAFGYLASAVSDGIKEGTIRPELDIKGTAIIIWSFTIGLFNTLIKKRNYIEHSHKRNPHKLLFTGLDMILKSISNEKMVLKNEKEK